jgi:mercuric ion binding protein
MKNLILIFLILAGGNLLAQDKNAKGTLEVDGVCMMCKLRIEKAAIKSKGVKSAVWNVESHQLSLIFDENKTSLEAIQKNIAAVGHDTGAFIATDEAYNSVDPCCRYRDEGVKESHKNGEQH